MIEPPELAEHDPSEATPAFIEMLSISKRFGGVRALNNVDFTVRPAEIHCLAGENGCGKSTLIKILAGVYARAYRLSIRIFRYFRIFPWPKTLCSGITSRSRPNWFADSR